MLRSVAVLLALLILPSFASGQEPLVTQQGTHEVVKGETLWELAGRYLEDPFRWPLIYEANRDRIEDPHWIYPHQVFIIPGLESGMEPGVDPAQVRDVAVREPEREPTEVSARVAGELPACPGPGGRTVFYQGSQDDRGCTMEIPTPSERTAFWADPSRRGPSVSGPSASRFYAVPRSLVYSIPWLEELEAEVPALGQVSGLLAVDSTRTDRARASVYEKVQIEMEEGVSLQVGDLLQTFDVGRTQPGLGQVMRPTGILVVTAVEEAGVVAFISAEFGRVMVGQRVRSTPSFHLELGERAVEVESNLTATILGFNKDLVIQGFGHVAFLDVGEAQGIEIGDEFIAYVNRGDGWTGEEAVRLQVVLVNGNQSSARVIGIVEPVLKPGSEVHLVKKM